MLGLASIPGALLCIAIGNDQRTTLVAASLPLSIWVFAVIPFGTAPSTRTAAVFLPLIFVVVARLLEFRTQKLDGRKRPKPKISEPSACQSHYPTSDLYVSRPPHSIKHIVLIVMSFITAGVVDVYRWRGFPFKLFNLVPQNIDYTFHLWQVSKIALNGLQLPNETVMVDSFNDSFWSYQYGAHLIPGLISDGSISSSGTSISLFLFLLNSVYSPILIAILVSRFTNRFTAFALVPVIHLISPNYHLASLGLYAFNVGLVLLISCMILLVDWTRRRDLGSLTILSISTVTLGITHKTLLAFFVVLLICVCCKDLVNLVPKKLSQEPFTLIKSQFLLASMTLISGYYVIFFSGNYGQSLETNGGTSINVLKYLFGDILKQKNLDESLTAPILTLVKGGSYLTQSTSVVFGLLSLLSVLWISFKKRGLGLIAIGVAISLVARVVTASVDVLGIRRWVAGMWFGEVHRVAAVSDIFLICTISIFLAVITKQLGFGDFRTVVTAWLFALLLTTSISSATKEDTFSGWISSGKSRVVSPEEVRGFQQIDNYIPAGRRVFNFFGDGSALAHFESALGVTWIWGDITSDPQVVPYVSDDLDAHANEPSESTLAQVLTGFEQLDVCGILISSGNVHMWAPAWWEIRSFEGFDQLVLSEDVMLFVYSDPPERCQV